MILQELTEKYPKIFVTANYDCPTGWLFLVDKLCKRLQFDVDNNKYPQIICSQLKEKFGGLRFYTGGANDQQEGAIRMAESLSYYTCMTCGALNETVKQVNVDGWIETLCDKCVK